MRKLLPYLLSSDVKTYRYTVPNEVIVEKMAATFRKSGRFFSEPDFDGRFTGGKTFEMSVESGAFSTGNVKFGSLLKGKISDYNGETFIETTVRSNLSSKVLTVLVAGTGIVLLLCNAMDDFKLQVALAGLGMFLLGPFVCNCIAGVSNSAIRERFEKYIDKEIKKTNAPNTGLPK